MRGDADGPREGRGRSQDPYGRNEVIHPRPTHDRSTGSCRSLSWEEGWVVSGFGRLLEDLT